MVYKIGAQKINFKYKIVQCIFTITKCIENPKQHQSKMKKTACI